MTRTVNSVLTSELKTLFSTLREAKLSHGDCKGANILIVNNKPILIDLDAMKENAINDESLHQKDIKRFLRNFKNNDVRLEGLL